MERPCPEPGRGEVLVRVAAAGIRLSDREVCEGRRAPGYVRRPVVPGDEWSGTVEAVGPGVDPALLGRPCVEALRSLAVGSLDTSTPPRYRLAERRSDLSAASSKRFTSPGRGEIGWSRLPRSPATPGCRPAR
ncbi:alcohol dehydrogenase catalytic domain-containing protein [Streptomyces roseolus]